MTDLDRFAEYDDFRDYAREVIPDAVFDHLDAGAMSNWSRDENVRAYYRWVFRKRLMRDVADTDLSTEVLGNKLDIPVIFAPSAFHKFAHPDGELATAAAAHEAGTAMCLSTLSSTSLEDVAATGVTGWQQLQIHKDRDLTIDLTRRAEKAGFTAMVLTVDAPNYGIRPRDKRAHMHLPADIKIANLAGRRELPHRAKGEDLMAYLWEEMEQSATWEDAAWYCSETSLPVIAKGVMTVEEARNAVQAGCAGIVVSNQGGRQLDGDPATIDVLPAIVAAVGGEVEVLVDGGVRDGTHVLKALCVGAKAVLVGRPQYWGLAVGGQEGVARVLELYREGLENAAQMVGLKRVREADAELVARVGDVGA